MRLTTQEIASKLKLNGQWGDGWAIPSSQFIVYEDAPNCCPNCSGNLEPSESTDSNAESVEHWVSCDDCNLIWSEGTE